MKRNNGITLIALVITIIVLIILASVSVIVLVGEDGVINRAQKAKEQERIAKILEDLNIYEGELAINSESEMSIRSYLDYAETKEYNIVEEDNDDKSKFIIVDGKYVYLVEDVSENTEGESENGEENKKATIKITYLGKPEDLVTIVLEAKSGEYTFPQSGEVKIIKNSTNGEIKVESLNPEIATAEKIDQETFRVTPGTVSGEAEIRVISQATGKSKEKEVMYTAIVKNGTLNVTVTGYSGDYDEQEHKITVNCEQEGAEITYMQEDGKYSSINPGYSIPGEYAISYKVELAGYTPVSGTENIVIGKLEDSQAPVKAVVQIAGDTNVTSLPATLNATVTHKDTDASDIYKSSDIDITKCKYIFNTSSSEIGTNASNYTGTFSINGQTLELVLNNTGNYYLHVLSVDQDGNANETIKGPISVSANYHQHTGSSSSGTGCYTSPNYHTSHTSACYSNTYHYHSGSSSAGTGCYRSPNYHSHTSSCYSTSYHYHSGSSSSGGGCYGKANYHSHTTSCYSTSYHYHSGSSTSGGGCYGTALYHSHNDACYNKTYHNHTGSSTSGGGCYGTAVKHKHTGSSSSGGGCYGTRNTHTHTGTPTKKAGCYQGAKSTNYTCGKDEHKHVNSCYVNTCGGTYQPYKRDRTHTENLGQEPDTMTSYSKCSKCGNITSASHTGYDDAYPDYPSGTHYKRGSLTCTKTAHTHSSSCKQTVYALSCGYSEVYYTRNCGKTTSTIDYYTTNCGYSDGQLLSSTLTCTKSTTTPISYKTNCGYTNGQATGSTLTCTKSTTTPESYSLNCGYSSGEATGSTLTCGKTTNTIVSYSANCGYSNGEKTGTKLSCGKDSSYIDSYSVGCGKTGTIVSYSISY